MSKEANVTVYQKGKYHDFDKTLSELGGDHRLQIIRKEPSWCDGMATEYNIDPEEPVSAEEIRRRWGGRRLQAKIINPDGTFGKQKTFNFPDPPRDEGVELVMGPYGTPIRKDQLDTPKTQEVHPQPAANDMQTTLLQTLIQAQASQNTNMQNMLVQRVNHLEGLLERRSPDETPSHVPQPDSKPFDGLKDTIKMIKEMEQLKAIMGAAQGAPAGDVESSPWTGTVEKMLDFVLERERVNMQTKQAQATAAQQIPVLPRPEVQPTAPAPPPTQSDVELFDSLRNRLANADNETKAQLMQAVLGEDIDDVIELIPENELVPEIEQEFDVNKNDSCPTHETDVDSVISAEDRAELGGNDGSGATASTTAQSLSETP